MNVRRIVWALFFVTLFLNFSALTMTSFMITAYPCDGFNKCVVEANPTTAYVFDVYGIPVMYTVLAFMWLFVFVAFRTLSFADKRIGSRIGLFVQILLLVMISPMILWDFIANISVLIWVVF